MCLPVWFFGRLGVRPPHGLLSSRQFYLYFNTKISTTPIWVWSIKVPLKGSGPIVIPSGLTALKVTMSAGYGY